MANNKRILYCMECNETFTEKEYRENNRECPVCNAPSIEVWGWKGFLKDNPTLPENPERGKKYNIHEDYSK